MDVLIEPVNNRFNPFFEDPILDEEEEEEEEEEELLMMMVTMVTMMMIMMLLLLIQRQRQQRHDNNNNNYNVMIRKRRRPHHQFGDYVEHMRLFQRRRVAGNKHTGFMFLNKVDYHTGTILAKNFRRLIGFSNHEFTTLRYTNSLAKECRCHMRSTCTVYDNLVPARVIARTSHFHRCNNSTCNSVV